MGASESREEDSFEGKAQTPPPFEVLGRLGSGAYGDVTRRRNAETGEELAVKAVPFHLFHWERRAKVHREALLLKRLNHPNVVRFRGLWVQPGALGIRGEVLIGMEICNGSLAGLFGVQAPCRAMPRQPVPAVTSHGSPPHPPQAPIPTGCGLCATQYCSSVPPPWSTATGER